MEQHAATALAGGGTTEVSAVGVAYAHVETDSRDRVLEARMRGYEGDPCGECGNFTLVRNGTCMKCDTCGGTSGCS